MNGTGLSAGDILAMTRDNGAFDWSWIIGLIVVGGLFGNGGFGFGGANGAITEEYIANQFTQRDIFNNQTAMLEGNNALTRDILENRFNCSQNACNTQKEILESRYTTQLGFQNTQANLASCCCTLENAIHAEGEATRNMIQEDKIQQLRDQVYTTNLSLNNANLANQIISTLQPMPKPSYITNSPYFSYNMGYGSCGCGSTTII